VAAESPDGVVEAIEAVGHKFALGVQWHPEYGLTALDNAVMAALVNASRPK
jgi:putative glutamine amidotransferase